MRSQRVTVIFCEHCPATFHSEEPCISADLRLRAADSGWAIGRKSNICPMCRTNDPKESNNEGNLRRWKRQEAQR